jgi:hypothetical protein
MSPISNVSANADLTSVGGQFALAVQRKVNDSDTAQGEAELALIQSASAPEKATSGSVGTQLHVVA